MATVSSSDESSTAPRDFHLSSSIDSDSRLSPNRQKCPLCRSFKKAFYCRDCVQNGNFTYSTVYAQSYIDAHSRCVELKAKCNELEAACYPYLEKKLKVDKISSEIQHSNDRIRYLRLAIEERRTRQASNRDRLHELRARNEKLARNLPKYEERVQKLETYVATRRDECDRKMVELQEKRDAVKRLRRVRVGQLVNYVFPITDIPPQRIEMEASEDESTTAALSEASNTAYVTDRWILAESPSSANGPDAEHQYAIVAPRLPGSGNYSAYIDWVVQQHGSETSLTSGSSSVLGAATSVPCASSAIGTSLSSTTSSSASSLTTHTSITSVSRNSAYGISAALVYTAQLVNVIAYYLDARLPHKVSYADFCSAEMNERRFRRRVARLNANILYLCFSQNVSPERLGATRTLQNILQLVDTARNPDFGRSGPMEVDTAVIDALEESLMADLELVDDDGGDNDNSDSEEGDTLPTEWEAVPHVVWTEASSFVGGQSLFGQQQSTTMQLTTAGGTAGGAGAGCGPVVPNTQQQQQQASSMAGGLVNSAAASIASIWRGFTGR